MPEEKYFDLVKRRMGEMKTERTSFINHYREISQFIIPRRGRFYQTDRNKGDKRHTAIINSRGVLAHRTARAGMQAGAISPTRPWFMLGTPDPDLMEFQPVKEWLSKVELILRAVFNQSNFYNMTPTMLGELIGFGTGCMSHEDDFENVARFYTHTAGSYMIDQNDKYVIDTLGREYQMSVGNMVKKFGLKNVSSQVQTYYDRGSLGVWWPVMHFVAPNEDYKPGMIGAQGKSWRSVYYEADTTGFRNVLSEKGFDRFPCYVPRWDVAGEDVYGTNCPGMEALGDVKGLQIAEKRKAQAIDKMTNPPLKGPPSVKNISVSALPGGVTSYQADPNGERLMPIYQVEPHVQELMLDMEKTEKRINEVFHVDMFLSISTMEGVQPKNMLELAQRNEERLQQLGPVLERVHGELLNHVIDRTFDQCLAAKILPPPPDELSGVPLKIEYISTLAQAQRAVATGAIERVFTFGAQLAGSGFTGALDKLDADQAIDLYSQAVGAPPSIVITDEIVQARRAEKEKQAQMERMGAMAQQAANTGKMLSDAKTGDESLLTKLKPIAEASAKQAKGA